jgi:hypothetical protein
VKAVPKLEVSSGPSFHFEGDKAKAEEKEQWNEFVEIYEEGRRNAIAARLEECDYTPELHEFHQAICPYWDLKYGQKYEYRESQTREFKQWTDVFGDAFKHEMSKAICGFLNGVGGKLYVGIDNYGFVRGIDEKDNSFDVISNHLTNICGSCIYPAPVFADRPTIQGYNVKLQKNQEKYPGQKRVLAVIDVPEGLMEKKYYFTEGRYYLRMASGTIEMTKDMLNEDKIIKESNLKLNRERIEKEELYMDKKRCAEKNKEEEKKSKELIAIEAEKRKLATEIAKQEVLLEKVKAKEWADLQKEKEWLEDDKEMANKEIAKSEKNKLISEKGAESINKESDSPIVVDPPSNIERKNIDTSNFENLPKESGDNQAKPVVSPFQKAGKSPKKFLKVDEKEKLGIKQPVKSKQQMQKAEKAKSKGKSKSKSKSKSQESRKKKALKGQSKQQTSQGALLHQRVIDD